MSIPKIYGFNKTSEAGVKVFAPSVFIQGCNLQCPFCFNSVLAKSQMKKEDEVPLSKVDNFIKDHKPEMIMISGGEPLMLKNLEDLVDHFRIQRLKIGLSTHGIFSDRLFDLLPKLDYVALDVKSSNHETYKFLDLINDNNSFAKVKTSHQYIRDHKAMMGYKFDYEVRTTLYPPYVNMQTIHDLGQIMNKKERWVLQQYRPTKKLYDMKVTKGVEPYDWDTLQEMLAVARTYTKEAHLRYV